MFNHTTSDYDLKIELMKCFGGLATVYLAQHLPSRQHVAVKKYKMSKAENSIVNDEISKMLEFHHPNILQCFTTFTSGPALYVIMPLMCFGSCKDTIRNCFAYGFPELFIALILRDMLNALEYMHRHGWVHRSIRSSHILLNQTKAVLCGFRDCINMISHGKYVRSLHDLTPFNARSINWLAPEVLEQNLLGYDEKSDIYSIGITCCELANGIEPYASAQPTFMLTEKLRGNVPALLDRTTTPAYKEEDEEDLEAEPSESTEAEKQQKADEKEANKLARKVYAARLFSDEFHQFTEICLQKKPENRPEVKLLLGHAFLKQCRHNSILDQLQRYGMEITDYSQLRDESLELENDLDDMNLQDNDWEWDF